MKIICNPNTYAGKARKKWPKYIKAFKEAGLDFEVEWTKGVNDAIRITKESVKDHKIIGVYGGDGTVNEVVTGIGQTGFENTMAILPVGRGNDSAYALHLTLEMEDMVEMLVKKEVRKVDCTEVNDGERYVFSLVGIGISGAVAEGAIGAKTSFTYTKNLLANIFKFKTNHMKVDIDDGKIVREMNFLDIAIGNGVCAGNKKILCPGAVIDDGLLDITLIGDVNFIQKLYILGNLDTGKHVKHKKVEQLLGKKVVVENLSSNRVPNHFMGEMFGDYPYKFVCKHKVLSTLKMPDHITEKIKWR